MLPTNFRFIWQSGFREDFIKSANQKEELPVSAMFVNGSGQNVQSLERAFHRCFMSSFSLFDWRVSEEKIKMWKVNEGRTPSDGKSSHCLWQGELKTDYHNITEILLKVALNTITLILVYCTYSVIKK